MDTMKLDELLARRCSEIAKRAFGRDQSTVSLQVGPPPDLNAATPRFAARAS
jgi:hypothetical protein